MLRGPLLLEAGKVVLRELSGCQFKIVNDGKRAAEETGQGEGDDRVGAGDLRLEVLQHPPPALPRVEAAEVVGEVGVVEREDVLERAERVGLALPAAELLGEHGEVGLPVLDPLDPALEAVDEGLEVGRRRLVFQGGVEALGELSEAAPAAGDVAFCEAEVRCAPEKVGLDYDQGRVELTKQVLALVEVSRERSEGA